MQTYLKRFHGFPTYSLKVVSHYNTTNTTTTMSRVWNCNDSSSTGTGITTTPTWWRGHGYVAAAGTLYSEVQLSVPVVWWGVTVAWYDMITFFVQHTNSVNIIGWWGDVGHLSGEFECYVTLTLFQNLNNGTLYFTHHGVATSWEIQKRIFFIIIFSTNDTEHMCLADWTLASMNNWSCQWYTCNLYVWLYYIAGLLMRY